MIFRIGAVSFELIAHAHAGRFRSTRRAGVVEDYSFTAPANDSERPIVREMTA